jgi:hypothetical protein
MNPKKTTHQIRSPAAPTPQIRRQAELMPSQPPPSQAQVKMERFFQDVTERKFDPSQRTMAQFQRAVNGNCVDRQTRKEWRSGLVNTVADVFNDAFGTEVNLENMQKLCRLLRCRDIPDTLWECKEARPSAFSLTQLTTHHGFVQIIGRSHVNIFNFLDAELGKFPVQIFETEEELAKYTRKTEQFFPRSNSVAGGLLRFLLRQIHDPQSSNRGGRRRDEIR